jgi:hypothetical protein
MNTKKLNRAIRNPPNKFLLLAALIIISFTGFYFTNLKFYYEISKVGLKKYRAEKNYERIDWNDYEFMKYERERTGIGEQGKGHQLTDPKDIELDEKLEQVEGLNVIVSDKISVNRSVKDTRAEL